MKVAVEKAHFTVVNVPAKGVERRSNQGKVGKLTLAYTRGALKLLFTNRFRPNLMRR